MALEPGFGWSRAAATPSTDLQNCPAAVGVHRQVAEGECRIAHGGHVTAAQLLQQLLDAARVCEDGLAALTLHSNKRERVHAFPDCAAAAA